MHRNLLKTGSSIMLAAGLTTVGASTAYAAPKAGWHVQQVFTYCSETPGDMATTGPDAAWVVALPSCEPYGIVVNYWDGRQWTQLPLAPELAGQEGESAEIAASSPGNVLVFPNVATGSGTAISPERWNGTGWSSAGTLPDSSFMITNAVAFSPADVWLSQLNQDGTSVAYRYNGSAWDRVRMPGEPVALTGVSASDIWAAGPSVRTARKPIPQQSLIAMNWTGARWVTIALPRLRAPKDEFPYMLMAAAAGHKDVWLTCGFETLSGTPQPGGYLLHWNGRRWQTARMPSGLTPDLTGLALDGHDGVWIGTQGTRDGQPVSRASHYAFGGKWTTDVLPAPAGYTATSLSLWGVPRSAALWAVGTASVTGTGSAPQLGLADRYEP